MAVGFTVDPDIGSAALMLPSLPEGGPSLLDVSTRHAVTMGLISQEEADEATGAHRAAAAAGYGFAAVTVFGFLLRKPG